MIKHRLLCLSISAGVVLLACAALFCCLTIGRWLAVSDHLPNRIDVVFMFFGENHRFSYSRGLMERFPGATWVMSDNFRQYSRVLSREGFDMSRVAVLDTCRYTLSEITALGAWLQDNREALVRAAAHDTAAPWAMPARTPVVRVGLVSSPCHMRRIRFMARDVIRDTAFSCYCLPVPLERYGWTSDDLRRWWRTRALRTWVASETAKLLWYWLFF
jgi:hypothetical protein